MASLNIPLGLHPLRLATLAVMSSVPRLSKTEAQSAYDAARKVVQTHELLAAWLRPGVTLAVIDAFVAKSLAELQCRSCFKDYKVSGHPPFPSHACLSVNECVVHGTAGYYREPLKPGDVLKIDIGVWFRGWVGDAAWTYVFGQPTPTVANLMKAGKESLRRGIAELRPANPYLRWAEVVQDCVEGDFGVHCIENWGGHGYGRSLHGPPHILNHRPLSGGSWPEKGNLWQPGNLVAVEPMIAAGTGRTTQRPFNSKLTDWPVFVADGSMSVHYEHDVLITEDGQKVLTEGLENLNDIIV